MTKHRRFQIVILSLYVALFVVIARLFYWQIVKGDSLQAIASDQYQKRLLFQGSRGDILTADGYTLVTNQKVYRLFLEPTLLEQDPSNLVDTLMPVLESDLRYIQQATESSVHEELTNELRTHLIEKIETNTNKQWIQLVGKISHQAQQALAQKNIKGLGFDPYEIRMYPEASMAAQLTGFVGKDENGYDIGYFGVEGALEKELQQRTVLRDLDTGWLGLNLFSGTTQRSFDGRDIILSIRRDVQNLLEKELQRGMELYGAQSGEIIVMEPSTGKILGMASFPRYDQPTFYEFDEHLYKNPSVADLYEPGSTFKPLVMAAGIETEAITPETKCPQCDGPRRIASYTIKTWNEEYHPDITMTDALAKSDNVAMVYVAEKVGAEKLREIIQNFGIGKQTSEEIQEDTDTPFPQKWGPVELATISFGQGISTTSLQLVRAIGAIANQGIMMKPSLLEAVVDPYSNQTIQVQPQLYKQVISPQTAQQVTEMMVVAANSGEAQWTASKTHSVAAKTGTAQIAVDGKYDPNKTIASFIGFSPASAPKYLLFVKLKEPQSSPWAAETAAPLWYRIADKLNLLLNVPPDLLGEE